MCTKAEVREVVRENNLPIWAKIIFSSFGVGFLALMSWALFTVHSQEGINKDLRGEVISMIGTLNTTISKNNSNIMSKMNTIDSSLLLNNARLTGKIELLTTQLKNIKEIAINRNKASDEIENERCKAISDRIKINKQTIERYHGIRK